MSHNDAQSALPYQDWSRLQRRLVWIYEGPVSPSNRDMVRPFENNGAWLIRKGSARVESAGEMLTAQAGEWLIPAPGRLTRQMFEPGSEIVSIRFRLAWPDGTPLFAEGLPITFAASRFPALARATAALNRVTPKPPGVVHTPVGPQAVSLNGFTTIENQFSDFLVAWCEVMQSLGIRPSRLTRSDPRVRTAMALLNNLPRDERLAQRTVAKHVGLSAGQLDRLFIKQTGHTVRRYLENRRLAEASHLLESTTRQIKQIAFDLGFGRVSHFSAWFKKHAKVSAREFRASASHVLE